MANKFSKTTILQFVLIFVKFVLHPCLHLYLYFSYLGSYFYVSLSLAGAPDDGFLLNALKSLFRVPRVLLDLQTEMHSKRRYKICICSVILGELEASRNYKGVSVLFPKLLYAIERFTKVRIFLISLSITLLNSKSLGFLFSTKIS